MKPSTRRDFVKQLIGTALAYGITTRFAPSIAMAEGLGTGKYFLNIVLPGGLDSFFAYPFYNSLMGTMVDLRGNLAVPQNIRPLDSEMGLHENLGPIHFVHQSLGNMKIVSKVGFPCHSRSHYNAQSNMSTMSCGVVGTGWIRKLKQEYPERFTQYNLWGFNVGTQLDLLPSGGPNPAITSLNKLAEFNHDNGILSGSEAQNMRNAQMALLQVQRADQPPLYDLVRESLLAIPGQVASMQDVANVPVSANYGEGLLADQLKDVARILLHKKQSSDTSDVVIQVRYGQFDHHAKLLEKLPPELIIIGQALAGLIQDLRAAQLWNQTVICLSSEFSRTTRANSSEADAGTDHGMAQPVLVMGGAIRGGQNFLAGEHPTQAELRDSRNFLLPAIAPQNIFHEIYEWMSLSPQRMLGTDYTRTGLNLFT